MNKLSEKEVIKEFCFAFFVSGMLLSITMLCIEWNGPRTDFGLLTIATSFAKGFGGLLLFMLLPFLVVTSPPYEIGISPIIRMSIIIPFIIIPASIYYLYKKLPISKIKYRKYLLTVIVLIWVCYGVFVFWVSGIVA